MTHEEFFHKVCEYWEVSPEQIIKEELYSSYKLYVDPRHDPAKFGYDEFPTENKLLGVYRELGRDSMFTLYRKKRNTKWTYMLTEE